MTRSEFILVLMANIIGWPIIHMGAAWVGIRLPASSFRPESMWFHEFAWERGGRFYERVFRIKAWKDLLPDGAAWIPGGFRKKTFKMPTTPIWRGLLWKLAEEKRFTGGRFGVSESSSSGIPCGPPWSCSPMP